MLPSILYGDLISGPYQPDVDTEELLVEYYRLVRNYSSKKLTYKSDKLPAFSSLAQRIHAALPDKCEYLAGLWSHDFLRGLIWHRLSSTATHSLEYRAPSWSWAITDDAIAYYQPSEFKIVRFKLELLGWDMSFRDPDNPYGEIKAGHVVVRGYTTPLVRSQQTIMINTDIKKNIGSADYDEPDPDVPPTTRGRDIVFVILRDDGSLIEFRNQNSVDKEGWVIDSNAFLSAEHLVLLIGIRRYDEGGENAECLILREVSGRKEKEFERVGYLQLTQPNQAWMEMWDYQMLKLV